MERQVSDRGEAMKNSIELPKVLSVAGAIIGAVVIWLLLLPYVDSLLDLFARHFITIKPIESLEIG
jgi:hypothetical protein